jgi:CheY-like chemotaxis protein/two-component sensor histidine kinase
LVDDLLDVSRVMRGKVALRKEALELATVIARAVEIVQPLIEVQGHRLELSLPDEPLLVEADLVRLTQVVGNLLTNAAKYTDANGQICVSAAREGSNVALHVRDDGIGIAPDMLPHVFELFVQADHASAKAQGGLGIGLTLARNLVQMHGGTIEAHSAGLGRGSEFIVRLPLLEQQRNESGESSGNDVRYEASAPGRRLLVVDDNQDAATSLAMLLRLRGHDVLVAHDGPSALAIAASYRPDAVFLDIGMPSMDGYEVARRLRQQPGMEAVVIAALTGWGQQEDRRRTTEAGFDHHLVKPPDSKILGNLLDSLTG